ncbi:MAG: hypothetical protein K9K93_04040 [Acholeplasmataceae bacterium]|nr:hypothetical protein [Acholeplasmataceae bacterium]
MLKNLEIMHYIDKYRIEKGMPINQLTKGVMSTRNYSRLLSGDAELSFETYALFLNKLSIPLFEFAMYLYNCRFFETIHEAHFLDAVDEKRYKDADELIRPYMKDAAWGSVFAHKTIPLALKIVAYHLNKTTIHDLLSFSRSLIQLEQLVNESVITLDDFDSMFLFTHYCFENEKQMIIDFLIRILVQKEVIILSGSYDHTLSRAYRLAVQLMTSVTPANEHHHDNLKQIARIALEYQSRAKMSMEDLYLLEAIFKYYKNNKMTSPSLLREYVLSALGSNEEHVIQSLKDLLTDQEIEFVLSSISQSTLRGTNLFTEIFEDESIE